MQRKFILSILLIVSMAFCVGMGTYAYFTSQQTSTGNVFQTGTLSIDDPGQITALYDVDNIYPGWTQSKSITIHNSGTLDCKLRLSVQPLTGNALYDGATPLQVSVNGGSWVNINQLGYVDLQQLASGNNEAFDLAFKLPEAANNDYQGINGDFSFVFDATQVNNPGFTQ